MNKASVFQLYQHAPPIEFKSLSKWYELEPAYRTGRHDRIVTHWDDYRGDLPAAGRDSPESRDKLHRQIGTSSDH